MIGEDQFEDVATQALYVGRMGVDVLPLLYRRMTGGHRAARAALLHGHIHRAEPTGAEGREIGGVAKGRDCVETHAPRERQDGFVGFYFEGGVIEVGFRHGL